MHKSVAEQSGLAHRTLWSGRFYPRPSARSVVFYSFFVDSADRR